MKNILATVIVLFTGTVLHAQQLDYIIYNGKIIDGSGNSWYYGDVGIKDGKIVRIGKGTNWTAKRTIDAKGLIVAPGFVDVHTHIEGKGMGLYMVKTQVEILEGSISVESKLNKGSSFTILFSL